MNLSSSERRAELQRLVSKSSAEALARDEGFWAQVRTEYTRPADFTQLEFGWYHPCANSVLAAQFEAMKEGQRRGSHYKRGEMPADREAARADLARLAGAAPDEVVITRNATEALNIAIQGLPLERGDEIIHSDQDYPSVVEALQQRARRDGVVLRSAALPLYPESDDEITTQFAANLTARTRAIIVTHTINFTGQVLPAKKLCAFARERGLVSIVDAAHSFAQLAFTVADLNCDFLGSSLHKWLGAPLGTGLLYVRRDRIGAHWPLFGDTGRAKDDVRKLEHFGNSPDAAHIGLREAIRWQEAITTPVKEARLRFLQRRWTDTGRELPRVRVLTPATAERHGAIGAFAIDGLAHTSVVETLMKRFGIFTNAFSHPIVSGIRVTPGLPTSLADIDRFAAALREIAA